MNGCDHTRQHLKRDIDRKAAEAEDAYQRKAYGLWKALADDIDIVLDACPFFDLTPTRKGV